MPKPIQFPLSPAEAVEQMAVVFDGTAIEYLQYDLWRWFRSVLENKVYQFRRSPVNLLYLRRHMGSLLTAAECLLQHGLQEKKLAAPGLFPSPDQQERQQIKDLSFLYENYGGRILHLSRLETAEPLQFIYRFFAIQSIDAWQEVLEEWLEYGLDKTGMSEFGETENLPETLEWLLGLCEACWLLHSQQKDEQKPASQEQKSPIEKRLQPLMELVIQALEPEAIFQVKQPATAVANGSAYIDWLIVIPDKNQKKPFQEMETLLDMLSDHECTLCCSLHQSARLKKELLESELYYRLVCQPGNQVYGSPFALPDAAESPGVAMAVAEKRFDQAFKRSLEFSASAQQCQQEGQYASATFLWHQAAELCLRGLMLALTGKERKTHELRVLLRYSRRLAPGLPELFPVGDEAAHAILQLLEKAYLDARYADDYSIETSSLHLAEKKVQALQEMVSKAWEQWIAKYGNRVQTR